MLDLGKTNINKIFWTYAIPSILMMIVQSTAGFIDSLFVGRYVGAEGLAAITLVMPIIMFLIGVGTMIAIGGTTLAAIEKGADNFIQSNNYFNVTTSLLLISGALGAISIYTLIPFLANLLGAEGEVLLKTVEYARYIAIFVPFFLLSFGLSFFLKLDGKPVATLIVMLSGTLTNIVLDYILIVKIDLGIRGAALATGISQVIPSIIFVILIIFKTNWKIKKPKYSFYDIRKIFFNGSSEFLSNTATAVTGVIFNYVVIRIMGNDGVAAFSVALQISAIATSIGYGIAEGSQVAISYNFGAKKYMRVKKMRNLTFIISLILGILLAVSSLMFSNKLAGLFLTDDNIINIADKILSYYSFSFIFICVNISVATYYTSIDDPIRSGAIAIYRSFIASVIGLLILPILFGQSGIWMTVIFVEVSTLLIGYMMIERNPFGKTKVEAI